MNVKNIVGLGALALVLLYLSGPRKLSASGGRVSGAVGNDPGNVKRWDDTSAGPVKLPDPGKLWADVTAGPRKLPDAGKLWSVVTDGPRKLGNRESEILTIDILGGGNPSWPNWKGPSQVILN